MTHWPVGIALLVVGALGCETPGTPLVRARAANDLACARDDVDVQSEGADHWTAFGCGRRIKYACSSENNNAFSGAYRCEALAPPGP